ncbi:MAG: hypothetical protein ACREOQ_21535 [Gemmatimonadales bacterium]
MADGPAPLKREVLALVGLVLVSDALFLAAYFLFDLPTRSGAARLGFTAVWTLVTLAIVLRGLARIRAECLRRRGGGRD